MKEIQHSTNHSSPSFRKKRYTPKQLLVIAVIGACLAIFSQMVRDAKRVLVDELWEEQGYAYPVKTEFVTSFYAGGVRNWLLQKGWDLDNPIVSSFHSVMGNAYESAMTKIPEEAGERELWYYRYYLMPQMIQKQVTPSVSQDVEDVFLKVMRKPIRSTHERDISKIKTTANLFNYFIQNIAPLEKAEEKEGIQQEMLKSSLLLLEKVDVQPFMKERKYKLQPVIYANNVMKVISWKIQSNDYSCKHDDIRYYLHAKRTLATIVSKYHNYESLLAKEQRQEMLQIAYKARDMNTILRQALLEKCQLDIQKLEQ